MEVEVVETIFDANQYFTLDKYLTVPEALVDYYCHKGCDKEDVRDTLEELTELMGAPLGFMPSWHPMIKFSRNSTYPIRPHGIPCEGALDHTRRFATGIISAPYQKEVFDEVLEGITNYEPEGMLKHCYIEMARLEGIYHENAFPFYVRLLPRELSDGYLLDRETGLLNNNFINWFYVPRKQIIFEQLSTMWLVQECEEDLLGTTFGQPWKFAVDEAMTAYIMGSMSAMEEIKIYNEAIERQN